MNIAEGAAKSHLSCDTCQNNPCQNLRAKKNLCNGLLIIWSIERKTVAISVSAKDGSLAKTMVKLIQKEKSIPSYKNIKVSETSIVIEVFKPINLIMLKVGWIFAKISCIKRKKLLDRRNTLEFVGRKGSSKSQRGWGKTGTIIRQPLPVAES